MSIFESNTPDYFAPQEKDEFIAFLDRMAIPYFVVMSEKDGVVACGGYKLKDNGTTAWLRWDMVKRDCQRQGLGRYLTLGRMNLLCDEEKVDTIQVGTSQYSYRFYERMDFEISLFTETGIAPGIDEYLLLLKFDEGKREAIRHEWRNLRR